MTEEMKPWQKGHSLEELQNIVDFYKNHNLFSFSPFTEMNKMGVASALDEGTLVVQEDLIFVAKTAKVSTAISYFDNIAAHKKPGDVVITKVAYKGASGLKTFKDYLETMKNWRLWITIFEEEPALKALLQDCGYRKLCSQYKSTAEILGVYASPAIQNACTLDGPEVDFYIPSYETATLEQCLPDNCFTMHAESILKKIETLDFANHYSNYNKGKSWSALSLRGYSRDITFIEKPAEVVNSKKFLQTYKKMDKYKDVSEEDLKETVLKDFKLQDTELMYLLSDEVQEIIKVAFPFSCEFDRIRLMKLNPGGGELLRHSDLQDPDVGTADGKTMRFHVPIITNPHVDFSAWDWDGVKQTRNFKQGCLFYLDQRKPHTVVNNGNAIRIHLVFDVIANSHTRKLIST